MKVLGRLLAGLLLVLGASLAGAEGLPALPMGVNIFMAPPPPIPPTGGLVLNGVSTSTISVAVPFRNFVGGDIQVWSAAGSTATVILQCHSYISAPWYPCYTVTDPDATGKYFSVPWAFEWRLNLTWTAGTIYGTIIPYSP
jgi:hypothetical protein